MPLQENNQQQGSVMEQRRPEVGYFLTAACLLIPFIPQQFVKHFINSFINK